MGWTTVNEAAVPILSAKHTHEELHDIPIVDKSSLVLMAQQRDRAGPARGGRGRAGEARRRLADLGGQGLRREGGQPGRRRRVEVGEEREARSHEPVEGYSRVTPAQIIAGLARIVDDLGLPHPLHLHCNNLGVPGNVTTTIETMKVLEGHRAHLAHLQFHAYGGDDWGTMRSEAAALAEHFNSAHEPHRRRGRDPLRRRRDDHRRRSVAAPAARAHRAQVGQPRRRERDRLRHRALRLQGPQPGQRRAVGGRTRAAAAHRRSLADLPDHRPSERRLLLAVPGDHPPPDGRRVPQGGSEEAPGQGAEAHRPRRPRPPVHALRDRDHHLRGPGARARPVAEGTSGRRRRRGRDDLSREAGRRPSCSPIRAT